MHEHAVPRAAVGPVAAPRPLARLAGFLERESLLVLCTAIFAIAFVLRLAG